LFFASVLTTCAAQTNPPTWPSTVRVFSPSDTDIQTVVDAAYANNGGTSPSDHGQFSRNRYAFLFKPGTYDVDVPVGYYTQVAGLGKSPKDVVFASQKGVYCEEGAAVVEVGSLDTFWRSAENFHSKASNSWWNGASGMLWAASQAAPVRRVLVDNDLILFRYRTGEFAADFASGGYLSNSQVLGTVSSGSQQQYFSRNNEVNWDGGVWNMVFVGTEGAPSSHCGRDDNTGALPFSNAGPTPTIAEKPYVSVDDSGLYWLNVPQVRSNSNGVDWSVGLQISFDQVYVADASHDTASTINTQLSKGMHVVLAPGIYDLSAPLELNSPNQVLLGLGLATLVSAAGQPVVRVGNVDGVRIGGVLLEAGTQATEALLMWGDGSHSGSASNPGLLADVFARVGGPTCSGVQAETMIQINSGHVIGDDLWLWRGDHCGTGVVVKEANPCDVGMLVNGDDVTMYGLAVEHTLKDLTLWNGERGATYFYQAELPYDVDQSYGDGGYVGYRVAQGVSSHIGVGIGVYHYFRDFAVVVDSGISVPASVESSMVCPMGTFLNGKGTIEHVINGHGGASSSAGDGNAVPVWYSTGPTPPSPPAPPTPTPAPVPTPTPPTPTPTPPTPTPPAPTPSPSPATCSVGDSVQCPGSSTRCGGDQCCPGGSTCPSADASFSGCPHGKTEDCTGLGLFMLV